jgi:hypothetical protein
MLSKSFHDTLAGPAIPLPVIDKAQTRLRRFTSIKAFLVITASWIKWLYYGKVLTPIPLASFWTLQYVGLRAFHSPQLHNLH